MHAEHWQFGHIRPLISSLLVTELRHRLCRQDLLMNLILVDSHYSSTGCTLV
jgi:hypothetical protein